MFMGFIFRDSQRYFILYLLNFFHVQTVNGIKKKEKHDGVGEANNITNYGGKAQLINEFSSKRMVIKVYILH